MDINPLYKNGKGVKLDFLECEVQSGKKNAIKVFIELGKKKYLRKYTDNEKEILMNIFYKSLEGIPFQMVDNTLINCAFETVTDNYDRLCNQNQLAKEEFEEGYLSFKEFNIINRRMNG